MEGAISQQLSEKKFSKSCEIIQNLAGDKNVNVAWIEKSRETTSAIVEGFLSFNSDTDPILIRNFADILSLCPADPILLQNFAHLTLLYILHPTFYFQFKLLLAQKQENVPPFSVPEWWPNIGGISDTDEFSSPLEFGSDLGLFVRTHAHEIFPIVHSISCILSQLETVTTESQPPWNCFAGLIALMSKSTTHRDLVTLIFCQEQNAIDVLNLLCGSSPSTSAHRYAKFLLESLLIRPSVLSSLSNLYGLQGATKLMQIYPQDQQNAFDVAAKTPFRFIIDLLNHVSGSSWFKNSNVITCISISAKKLEKMAESLDLSITYDAFNEVSDVNSLLTITTQFGCVVAQFLLENYGDSLSTSKFLRTSNVFAQSEMPPLAKPNYFFTEQRPLPVNDTLAMLMKLDEFEDLHRSLLSILKFLKLILVREVTQSIEVVSDEALAEKIYVRKIQPIYSFIVLVLKCNEKLNPESLTSEFTAKMILELVDSLLSSTNSSLAWTTLFNCATEASYGDITTPRLWLKLFKTICSRYKDNHNNELICDGFRRYSSTFHPFSNQDNSFDSPFMSVSQETSAVVAKSEYMFLYQNSARNKCDLDEATHSKMPNHYGMGGRQQSVHVDKFGKDRS